MTPTGDGSEIAEPLLQELYFYWSGKRRERRWPAPADIVDREILPLLPYVFTVKVLAEGRQFRFLRLGDDVAVGVDPTGQLQHEALPDGIYRDHITALFRRGAGGAGALYSRSSYEYSGIAGPRSISRLFLPLASDGARIDMMMIGQVNDAAEKVAFSAWQANPPTIMEEVELRLP